MQDFASIHDWLTEEGRKLYYSGCDQCRRMLDADYWRWVHEQRR